MLDTETIVNMWCRDTYFQDLQISNYNIFFCCKSLTVILKKCCLIKYKHKIYHKQFRDRNQNLFNNNVG